MQSMRAFGCWSRPPRQTVQVAQVRRRGVVLQDTSRAEAKARNNTIGYFCFLLQQNTWRSVMRRAPPLAHCWPLPAVYTASGESMRQGHMLLQGKRLKEESYWMETRPIFSIPISPYMLTFQELITLQSRYHKRSIMCRILSLSRAPTHTHIHNI